MRHYRSILGVEGEHCTDAGQKKNTPQKTQTWNRHATQSNIVNIARENALKGLLLPDVPEIAQLIQQSQKQSHCMVPRLFIDAKLGLDSF